MPIDAVSAVDADLARVNAASLQLAVAQAQESAGAITDPEEVESARAAAAAAEATLAQAEAALQADEAAAAAATPATTTATPTAGTASTASHFVTGPGGIVV